MKWEKLKKAEEKAKEINANLKAMDFNNKNVRILHGDGSRFSFKYAFLKRIMIENEEFVCVFTEHHGTWVWHKEDLEEWEMDSGSTLSSGELII